MKTNKQSSWNKLFLSIGLAASLIMLLLLTLRVPSLTASESLIGLRDHGRSALNPVTKTTFTVTGKVYDLQNSMSVPNAQVFAFSGAASVETFTNASGQYTLTLDSGFYDIVFNPPLTLGLASQVQQRIGQQKILDVGLPQGYLISGTVYSDTMMTHPVANSAIFAYHITSAYGLGLPPTKADGTYQLSLEAGEWELTFTPPHSVGLGPTRTVTTIVTNTTVNVVLPPGFTITGTVTKDGGEAVSNVDIFAQDPPKAGFGFSATNLEGTYTGTLPVGTFDILFFAPPFAGLGSTVLTSVTGPPDLQQNITLPAGYTVSGTIKSCIHGLAGAFIHAAPKPPISAGRLGGWGRAAGADGFYALTLQPGVYDFTVDPPPQTLFSQITMPSVVVTQDLTLNFAYDCSLFLPQIATSIPQPILKAINNNGDGNYKVNWQSPISGTVYTYTLQEATGPNFDNPNFQITSQFSYSIKGNTYGTYYYRLKAVRDGLESPWSNIVMATVTHLTIDNFDDGQDPNAIGGTIGWASNCSLSNTSDYTNNNPYGGSSYSYYLSFNATPLCFAVWQTQLLWKDYHGFAALTFQIKGAQGGERPNVYLQDKNGNRHYVDVEDFVVGPVKKVTQNWQEVRIPLAVYAANNVDLTCLDFFQIAFEWDHMSGTIYIDNIRFE